MSITVSIRGTARSVEAITASLAQRLPEARAFPGNESAELYVDPAGSDEVLVLSVWRTPEDADAYFHWREETGELERFRSHFVEAPTSRRFQRAETGPAH